MNEKGEDSVNAQYAGELDTVVGERKGTAGDIEDMKRMGKQQLFRVRPSDAVLFIEALSNPNSAQFLFSHHLWIRHDLNEYLASTSWVRVPHIG